MVFKMDEIELLAETRTSSGELSHLVSSVPVSFRKILQKISVDKTKRNRTDDPQSRKVLRLM